jgi:Na+/melibiose symporter-like transporter
MLPANLLGALVTPQLTKRYGKRKVFMYASIAVAVFSFGRHFVPDSNLFMIFALSALSSFSMMFCSIAQWGMLPDTVEYGQWKTGVRSEGIPFAFFSFMQKSGMALAGSIAAFIMYKTGYEANTELSAASETGIRWLFNIIPAFYSILCFVVLIFYKIDGPMFDRIMKEIKQD